MLQSPDIQARIAKNAAETYNWSPEEYKKFVVGEIDRYREVVEAVGREAGRLTRRHAGPNICPWWHCGPGGEGDCDERTVGMAAGRASRGGDAAAVVLALGTPCAIVGGCRARETMGRRDRAESRGRRRRLLGGAAGSSLPRAVHDRDTIKGACCSPTVRACIPTTVSPGSCAFPLPIAVSRRCRCRCRCCPRRVKPAKHIVRSGPKRQHGSKPASCSCKERASTASPSCRTHQCVRASVVRQPLRCPGRLVG